MKSNTKFALTAFTGLGVAALTVPAMAADVVYEEPPAPAPIVETAPVSTWAGPYAGLHLGYGFGGSVEDGAGGELETDGFLGGAFGGFNWQNGSFVYGLEGDINYSGIEGEAGGIESRENIDGSLRARAGVAVTPDVLVYGTAGVAAERLRLEAPAIPGASDTNVMIGYTVGAGTDVKLTEQVFARAEYRYTDFGSEEFTLPGVGTSEISSSNHRVMLGVGMKF